MKEPMIFEQQILPAQGDIFAPAITQEQGEEVQAALPVLTAIASQQDALDLAMARYDLEVMQKVGGDTAISQSVSVAQIAPKEEKKNVLRYLFGQPNAYAMLLEKRQKMAA